MGNTNSAFELANEARRASERFDECEIKVIRETFKDLCLLSGESTRIDKETFLQYFPLPGLLGERLFAVFDKKQIGEVDYEEFVCGLAVTCRGSWEEKVEFIFNIYDVHGVGAVSRDELTALLNHVPKSVMKFGRAMAMNPRGNTFASSGGSSSRASGSVTLRPPPVRTAAAAAVTAAAGPQPLVTPAAATGGGTAAATQPLGEAFPASSPDQNGNTTALPSSVSATAAPSNGAVTAEDSSSSSSSTTTTAGSEGGLLLAGEFDLPLPLGSLRQHSSTGSGLATTIGSDGSAELERTDEEMSHVSLDDVDAALMPPGAQADRGVNTSSSCAPHAHHYLHHFDEFTNNDIVNQAFEECDLNHDGKLSYNEFRLWVERNPMVTHFLQSVFPYDEYRDWCGDSKHLPFIHNHDIASGGRSGSGHMNGTRSPPYTPRGTGARETGGGDEEALRLLMRAKAVTANEAVQEGIAKLAEMLRASGRGFGDDSGLSDADSINNYSLANHMSSRHNEPPMSPRTWRVLHHQTVGKMGFLSKQGHRLRAWKQRWYVALGNCIYYYQHKQDKLPRGVVFLTGSFVEPLREEENERRGYWGLEVTRSNEHGHRRKLYANSRTERDKWVHELRRASEVVPIEEDFEIGEELGKGQFSRVCLCVNKHTLERKAVKIIEKETMDAEEKELLRAEIAIMKLVHHPNIIRMETVYESRQHIFIVMELHSGGELFDRIVGRPRFSEDEAFSVIYPLVESVAYLHEMGIVHRDLKPENILCGEKIGDIKIADFGLSKLVLPDEIMKMPCGTLSYVAPEVLTLNGYGREADIWSVGTIMYLLMRGRLPFDGDSREEIIERTINGSIDTDDEVWRTYSTEAKDLLLGLLNKDIKRRMSAKDVLHHSWITQRVDRMASDPEAFNF